MHIDLFVITERKWSFRVIVSKSPVKHHQVELLTDLFDLFCSVRLGYADSDHVFD